MHVRPPHLKPWRDGWRHLRFMLVFFAALVVSGARTFALGARIYFCRRAFAHDFKIGGNVLNVGTLVVACMTVIVGFQLVAFAFFTKVFAIAEGLLRNDPKLARVFKTFTLEKGLVISLLVLLGGIILLARSVWIWQQANYGILPSTEENLRRLIPEATLIHGAWHPGNFLQFLHEHARTENRHAQTARSLNHNFSFSI